MDLEKILMLFILFACLVCTFSIVTVVVEIIREGRKRRSEQAAPPVAAAPEPAPVAEPVVEAAPEPPVVEPEPLPEPEQVEEPAEEEETPDGVWIAASKTETLEEKYLALSKEAKEWYDEIEHYAADQPDVKHLKNTRYEDYKIGRHRIVKLSIRRGVVTCEFLLVNQDFNRYINGNKINVKQAATVMRIESDEAVAAAKNSIDIAYKAAMEEKQYQKEQQKARRREARAKAAANENV